MYIRTHTFLSLVSPINWVIEILHLELLVGFLPSTNDCHIDWFLRSPDNFSSFFMKGAIVLYCTLNPSVAHGNTLSQFEALTYVLLCTMYMYLHVHLTQRTTFACLPCNINSTHRYIDNSKLHFSSQIDCTIFHKYTPTCPSKTKRYLYSCHCLLKFCLCIILYFLTSF